VEVGRPWARLPQWSEVICDMVHGIGDVLSAECNSKVTMPLNPAQPNAAVSTLEFDLLAHSYGTAVANRLLRELCVDKKHCYKHGLSKSVPNELSVRHVVMIDPIVFGGASTGMVGCINQIGPDLSFAFCGNRAGVTTKEIMDYDLNAVSGNLSVYVAQNDLLLDIPLAERLAHRHQDRRYYANAARAAAAPADEGGVSAQEAARTEAGNSLDTPPSLPREVQLVVDSTDHGYHGRWLWEVALAEWQGWFHKSFAKRMPSKSQEEDSLAPSMGPCATTCMQTIMARLNQA